VTFVVDASVAVKWFVPETDSDLALKLRSLGQPLVAPDIMPVEIVNVFWKLVQRDEIDRAHARSALRSLTEGVVLYPAEALLADGLEIAFDLKQPIYDCLYIALAEQIEAPLVSADRKLFAQLRGTRHRSRITWIGNL
jgi:predicted nucleic acid-binding protein